MSVRIALITPPNQPVCLSALAMLAHRQRNEIAKMLPPPPTSNPNPVSLLLSVLEHDVGIDTFWTNLPQKCPKYAQNVSKPHFVSEMCPKCAQSYKLCPNFVQTLNICLDCCIRAYITFPKYKEMPKMCSYCAQILVTLWSHFGQNFKIH